MNLDIQWIDCATKKYQQAASFTIGKWVAYVETLPIIDLSLECVWSITDLKTRKKICGGNIKTTHPLTMLNGNPKNAFEECKSEAEKQLQKLIDKMLTEAVEKEVLSE